jgi:hypothetical protein
MIRIISVDEGPVAAPGFTDVIPGRFLRSETETDTETQTIRC